MIAQAEAGILTRLEKILHDFIQELTPAKHKKPLKIKEILDDKRLVMLMIRHGLPYSFYTLIESLAPFNESDWAAYFGISTKSLQRYKKAGERFKPLQSEKIMEMAEVIYLGLELFGSADKFNAWLNQSNLALGGEKPVDLLKDSYGKSLVTGELTRISHGIFV
ncbi:MAG TPA: DUF2384 domain-containing protein [Saprospiraceae bacterium]|nr:DUF2384 domain-containing protein [Saprospiraceae bacterium]HNT19734.1 DUF2384 domain-containing protein [Saprospiraceae bacterium]